MQPMPPMSWTKLAAAMHGKFDETLDRLADAVKDSILDWEGAHGCAGAGPVVASLPPVSGDDLVAALRGRVEDALRLAAGVVNDVRPGERLADRREEIIDLFTALACEAFEVALQLRLDAAAAELAGTAPPGDWAQKYRRMRVAEAAFPPPDAGHDL